MSDTASPDTHEGAEVEPPIRVSVEDGIWVEAPFVRYRTSEWYNLPLEQRSLKGTYTVTRLASQTRDMRESRSDIPAKPAETITYHLYEHNPFKEGTEEEFIGGAVYEVHQTGELHDNGENGFYFQTSPGVDYKTTMNAIRQVGVQGRVIMDLDHNGGYLKPTLTFGRYQQDQINPDLASPTVPVPQPSNIGG